MPQLYNTKTSLLLCSIVANILFSFLIFTRRYNDCQTNFAAPFLLRPPAAAVSKVLAGIKPLEQIAAAIKTDKGPKAHNYTGIYAKYFERIREKPIKLLEIGLFQGYSAQLWEAYFPNAELHFVDITDEFLEYRSSRSKYHFFSQTNVAALKELAQKINAFDVIIDDGGHVSVEVITSFEVLFPYLKPGGIYVIEDLHASYWKGYGGTANARALGFATGEFAIDGPVKALNGSSISFLKDLIDEVNFAGANTASGAPTNVQMSPQIRAKMSDYAKHIKSIHFYNSICFVCKKE